jgi:hypothetical protein
MSHPLFSQMAIASGTLVAVTTFEIFEAQSRLQQFEVGPDVVDGQHARRHAPVPGPRKWSMVSKNLATEIGFDR